MLDPEGMKLNKQVFSRSGANVVLLRFLMRSAPSTMETGT